MEIADAFVVNKADRDGVERLVAEIEAMLSLSAEGQPTPPLIQTVATEDRGIAELLDAVEELHRRLEDSGTLATRRRARLRRQLEGAVRGSLMAQVFRHVLAPTELEDTVERMARREVDPYTAATEIVERAGLERGSMVVDHLGIAVPSLDEAVRAWEALGFSVDDVHEVSSEKVKAAFLPAGEARLELLEPTDPGSVIARFLEKRSGLHHVCVLVKDLDATLERLRGRGVELAGEAPREGAGGCRVAFVHPRSASGVLLELKETPKPSSR
jgi:methylmalonyl-CoA/ethylmalonyl-CoA epimerase